MKTTIRSGMGEREIKMIMMCNPSRLIVAQRDAFPDDSSAIAFMGFANFMRKGK